MEKKMGERRVGTVSRGIRCPIFREGDDLAAMVTESVLAAAESEDGFEVRDRDIVAITESVVGRCQGNYATIDDIAADCQAKFGTDEIGIVFPIMSRNRIAIVLKGFAKAFKKAYILILCS